jgi:hypothetical protein
MQGAHRLSGETMTAQDCKRFANQTPARAVKLPLLDNARTYGTTRSGTHREPSSLTSTTNVSLSPDENEIRQLQEASGAPLSPHIR